MIPSSLRILSLKLGRAVNKVSVQKGSRVLIFHSICQMPETVIDVSPANFRDQLKYLIDEGYNVISLEELVKNKANFKFLLNKKLMDNALRINFDYCW